MKYTVSHKVTVFHRDDKGEHSVVVEDTMDDPHEVDSIDAFVNGLRRLHGSLAAIDLHIWEENWTR